MHPKWVDPKAPGISNVDVSPQTSTTTTTTTTAKKWQKLMNSFWTLSGKLSDKMATTQRAKMYKNKNISFHLPFVCGCVL